MIVLALLAAVGLLWLQRVHRKRAWLNGPHYVQQIQVLAPTKPMALPPVKPLKAQTVSPFEAWKRRA